MVFLSAIWKRKALSAPGSGMAKREVNERWQHEMGEFFVQPNGLLPDRSMQPLEEVFHL
jgi:L-rhamnose mutarotase